MSTLAPSGPLDEKSPPSVTTADDEKTMENNEVPGGTDATLASSAPSTSRDPGASSSGSGAGSKEATPENKPSASSPNAANMTPSKQTTRRKSRWRSFLSKVVPCISTSKAHPIELDESRVVRDSTSSASGPGKAETEAKKEAPVSTPPPTEVAVTTAPSTPIRPDHPTTSSAVQTDLEPPAVETEVIVPPSPTHHLLPPSETAGVTSGAVQPPGSTGREEEDDGQVIGSDDEGEQQDGAEGTVPDEDDEDAIVLRGGLGIPILVCLVNEALRQSSTETAPQDGVERPLLPPLAPEHAGRKCLVLDLDETLLHSSFKACDVCSCLVGMAHSFNPQLIPQCDYVVPVEIEWQWHNVYVIKRPGVDQFLKKMGELFEIVVFTASLSKVSRTRFICRFMLLHATIQYADPVLDKLDVHKVVSHRLFRESCYNHKGNYVKVGSCEDIES